MPFVSHPYAWLRDWAKVPEAFLSPGFWADGERGCQPSGFYGYMDEMGCLMGVPSGKRLQKNYGKIHHAISG